MEDHHHRSSDDISLFLNQILLRSSSSLSSTTTTTMTMTTSSFCSSFMGVRAQSFSAVGPGLDNQQDGYNGNRSRSCGLSNNNNNNNIVKSGMLGLDIGGDGMVMKNVSAGCFLGNVVAGSSANSVSSLSVGGGGGACGASENDADDHECECESEEGLEALVEEVQAKAAPPRSSSKRSRAAEVHNLSEKRRRSRINEKMKALQNLIPNSNKTDKASMLDEAIEYLKQLQLQVQMLSMRNGIALHPMCLPGLLQPIQFSQFSRGFPEENVSQHTTVTGSLPLNQEIAFNLPNQPAVSNQLPVPNMSSVMNSESSFGMESSLHSHFGSFSLHTSPQEICREDVLPQQQLNADQRSRMIGTCMMGRDQNNECLFLKNMDHSTQLTRDPGRKKRS